MIKAFIYFYQTIVSPVKNFDRIKEEKPIYPALIYLSLYGFLSYVYFSLSSSSFFEQLSKSLPPDFGKLLTNIDVSSYIKSPLLAIIFVLFPLVVTFISTSILDLFSQFILGKAKGTALFSAIAYSSSPKFLALMITILLSLLFKSALPNIINLLIISWNIVLYILAFSCVYETTITKSILILLTPFVILIILLSIYLSYLLSLIGITGI